jgi:phenylpropionate dioxygenase-like ring-hydroxylating dioxygenase large terminal subunit
MTHDPNLWRPVAASHDLPYRHVYQTRLDGQPLAIWRDSAGNVNVWEDRCPHRGVRFSVGNVLNDELRCQYHAWRFASGSGHCTLIPAQPGIPQSGAIGAKVWPVREQGGLVWTGVEPVGEPPAAGPGTPLRGIPIRRPAEVVEAALGVIRGAVFFVQPVDQDRCVVRGLLTDGDLDDVDRAIETLGRTLEAEAC